ncbi:phospholipid-transporting ATPase ABCA3-like [Brevipalpus obovatus]|uniref:phospholipid-transporting ATPase ABCA3-like n=1 Tax=Brevipalpus obovatus TaxID=246614 RepID=UPI003D9F7576
MTGHKCIQIIALVKKDLTVRQRAWIGTLFELCFPIFVVYSQCQILRGLSGGSGGQEVQQVSSRSGKPRVENRMFPWVCYFTPESSEITELVEYLGTKSERMKMEYAQNETDMNEKAENLYLSNQTYAYGLIFNSSKPETNFTLRTPVVRTMDPDEIIENRKRYYSWDEFTTLHWAITSFELKDNLEMDPYISQPPLYDSFDADYLSSLVKEYIEQEKSIPSMMLIGTLSLANLLVLTMAAKRIVTEKQKGSKELLRMMGVADCTYWLSKFINHFWIFIIQVLIMSTLLHQVFGRTPLLEKISNIYLMVMIMVFFVSNLLITFILTTIFNKPVLAVIAVILMRFFGIKKAYEGSFSLMNIFLFPGEFFGAWLESYSPDPPPLPFMIPVLIVPFWIIYVLILLYLDAVCPWQPGTVKPWNFPFKFSGQKVDSTSIGTEVDCDPKYVEKIDGEASIICSKVYKVYSKFGARKTAVENLSTQIYRNQMTALLGHNGAGKTTLMNMITGITSPTSGVVYLNGFNVQKDTLAARRSIALCPQHECLYENLTVEENFALCANLRGIDLEIVSKTIKLLQLQDKSFILASKLSGGMRRRVQLGMALATDSDIIILDEPTSGLDPETRRTVWDYLIQLRARKTILITTHFMEEAEALADQIIIMSGGRIKCIGSQVFLKTRLGAGYSVKMEKKSFDPDATATFVAKFYPKVIKVNDTTEEITFGLNIDESEQKSASFLDNIADFCDSLDKKKKDLGISSFTITTATLEDVFMKIAVDEGLVAEDRVTFAQVKDTTLAELREALDFKKEKGSGSFFSCYRGLVMKRWNYFRRDYGFIFYSFVIPIVAVFLLTSGSRLLPDNAVKTYNFFINDVSPNSFPDRTSQPSIILSASPNSTLRKCFNDINSQYDVKMITINETINEYLEKHGGKRSDSPYLYGIQDQGTVDEIKLYFKHAQLISKPMVVNNYLNILRCAGTGDKKLINTREQPFPKRPSYEEFINLGMRRRYGLLFIFPMVLGFVFASAYTFPAKENQMKAELIQRMAGLGDVSYWLSHLSFDMTYFTIVSEVMILFIVIWNSEILLSLEIMGKLSFFLLSKLLPSLSIVAGLDTILRVSTIVYACDYIRDIFQQKFDRKPDGFDEEIKRYCLDGVKPNYLELIQSELKIMMIMGLVLFLLVIVISKIGHRLHKCATCLMGCFIPAPRKAAHTEDEDVKKEKECVASIVKNREQSHETLVAHKLTKDYFGCACSRFRAVDDVSFTVHKKECFGLLGVNGAGKTTTFSMLVGDEPMTRGDAYVGDLHVTSDLSKYRENVSYCPQQDALLDLLTPEETLRLFARLRGIPGKDITKNVDYIIFTTDLTKFRKTLNCNLSGGNKRKLGLAIATVGGPTAMFLDEPTTGVDPASRRKIWATLVGLRESGRSSIVLTSHSMDECEALCNRIAIMAKGQMRCLGSCTHLKSKYGQGFTLIIKMEDESTFPSLEQSIQDVFPSAKLQDEHGATVQFHLTDPNLRWGDMFRSMKKVKEKVPIDNFYIQDTSIEQIFLSFAHEESARKK